jgi:hypothetical protein
MICFRYLNSRAFSILVSFSIVMACEFAGAVCVFDSLTLSRYVEPVDQPSMLSVHPSMSDKAGGQVVHVTLSSILPLSGAAIKCVFGGRAVPAVVTVTEDTQSVMRSSGQDTHEVCGYASTDSPSSLLNLQCGKGMSIAKVVRASVGAPVVGVAAGACSFVTTPCHDDSSASIVLSACYGKESCNISVADALLKSGGNNCEGVTHLGLAAVVECQQGEMNCLVPGYCLY